MKVLHYRRTRNIAMSMASEELRHQMSRNGISFSLRNGDTDAGLAELEAKLNEVERGLYDCTKGLYCYEHNFSSDFTEDMDYEDGFVNEAQINVRFEHADDLIRFEKHFMLMFKLSI